MPHVQITSEEFPIETKRELARILTERIARIIGLEETQRDRCTIRFDRVRDDDLAIGGSFVCDGKRPRVHLEYQDRGLDRRLRRELAVELSAVLARVLRKRPSELAISFSDRDPEASALSLSLGPFGRRWQGEVAGALGRLLGIEARTRKKLARQV
jgi:phenylpyruvate tautomerase PptA (4-oxalocrotonate tautomerase family)